MTRFRNPRVVGCSWLDDPSRKCTTTRLATLLIGTRKRARGGTAFRTGRKTGSPYRGTGVIWQVSGNGPLQETLDP